MPVRSYIPRLVPTLLLLYLVFGLFASSAWAKESRPHLVLNFAQMNELPWSAPEEQWQREVKPVVIEEIRGMRDKVQGARDRTPIPQTLDLRPQLGWSTLLEYMNYPMDTPSNHSPYVIKARRILEIAEELDFPVFLPLNGFQWWDELPELYNWWDSDGTHTDPKFFSRQDNPADFKRRFIAGYDPSNKWNVEWSDVQTPMKLNYRNWGGGGFVLAPPPNLVDNPKAKKTYRQVQRERLLAIGQMINGKMEEWRNKNKEYLFAGLSIGTEVSLNASATPKDEFAPYGFRATQDLLSVIPDIQVTTSLMKDPGSFRSGETSLSKIPDNASASGRSLYRNDIKEQRKEVVRIYLEQNARMITKVGIPKEQIYTHVLGEQDRNDPHYGGIAESAFNLYSNPGVSLYGYAKNPTESKEWNSALQKVGNPPWGILEYNAGDSATDWAKGLRSAVQNAGVTVIYNWDNLSESAKPAIRKVLTESTSHSPCPMTQDPSVHIQKGLVARLGSPEIATSSATLSPGVYVRFTQTQCADQTIYGQPEVFTVPYPTPLDDTPRWVRWLLDRELF